MSSYQAFAGDYDNPFVGPPPASIPSPSAALLPSTNMTSDNSRSIQSDSLNNYNPFEKKIPPSTATDPAVLSPQESSSYAVSNPGMSTLDDLERRQRELELREFELKQREADLHRRSLSSGQLPNNWPPLPAGFPWGPCFYQDIDVDIPVEYRRVVRLGYYLWIAHSCVFLFNIFGGIAYMVATGGSSKAGSTFGFSIVLAILFIPSSFVCWFRPLYKAFKRDSSFYFFMFFIIFAAQIMVLFLQCLGIDWFAGIGWINSLASIGYSIPASMIMFICALAFTTLLMCDVWLIVRVHRIYRGTGASFEKAKAEFAQGVYSNPTMRAAAVEAGTGAVRAGGRF